MVEPADPPRSRVSVHPKKVLKRRLFQALLGRLSLHISPCYLHHRHRSMKRIFERIFLIKSFCYSCLASNPYGYCRFYSVEHATVEAVASRSCCTVCKVRMLLEIRKGRERMSAAATGRFQMHGSKLIKSKGGLRCRPKKLSVFISFFLYQKEKLLPIIILATQDAPAKGLRFLFFYIFLI